MRPILKSKYPLLVALFAFVLVIGIVPAGAQDTVTLQVWDYGGVEFAFMDTLIIPAFEAKYPNIHLEHLGVPESDYNLKVETAIAGHQAPDIAVQTSKRIWKAGHVIPLDDYFARDGFKPEDFYPIFQAFNMLDGHVYANAVTMSLWGMMINVDLFTEAGLTPPTVGDVISFDDWLTYARAINKPNDDLAQRVWGSVDFTPMFNSMNNYMSSPYVLGDDGRDCLTWSQTPDWQHAWGVLQTANAEELTPDSNAAMLGDTSFDDLFKQGKIGMTYASESDYIAAKAAGVNAAFVGQPVVTPGWTSNVGAWDVGYGIMAQSEHPEEAWTFVKWMMTDGAVMIGTSGAEITNDEINSSPPTYRPLATQWAGDDPFRLEVLQLQENVSPPPFNPDIWTSVDPFYKAWQQMTQEGVPVADALAAAADECQGITDDLWDTWDSLGS